MKVVHKIGQSKANSTAPITSPARVPLAEAEANAELHQDAGGSPDFSAKQDLVEITGGSLLAR